MSGARAQPHVRAKYKDECAACFQWIVVDVFGMPAARKNNVHGYVHSTSKNKDAKGCPVMLLPAGQRRSRTPQMVAARASVVAAELQAAHAEQPAQSNEHAGTHTRTRTRTSTSTGLGTHTHKHRVGHAHAHAHAQAQPPPPPPPPLLGRWS